MAEDADKTIKLNVVPEGKSNVREKALNRIRSITGKINDVADRVESFLDGPIPYLDNS